MNAAIRELIRQDHDDGDPWGSTMSHWFAVADMLHRLGYVTPPEWEYQALVRRWPAAALFPAPDPEEWPDSEYAALWGAGEIDVDDLTHAGNVLCRYVAILDRAGHSY